MLSAGKPHVAGKGRNWHRKDLCGESGKEEFLGRVAVKDLVARCKRIPPPQPWEITACSSLNDRGCSSADVTGWFISHSFLVIIYMHPCAGCPHFMQPLSENFYVLRFCLKVVWLCDVTYWVCCTKLRVLHCRWVFMITFGQYHSMYFIDPAGNFIYVLWRNSNYQPLEEIQLLKILDRRALLLEIIQLWAGM